MTLEKEKNRETRGMLDREMKGEGTVGDWGSGEINGKQACKEELM